jgi:hypothetical protein
MEEPFLPLGIPNAVPIQMVSIAALEAWTEVAWRQCVLPMFYPIPKSVTSIVQNIKLQQTPVTSLNLAIFLPKSSTESKQRTAP